VVGACRLGISDTGKIGCHASLHQLAAQLLDQFA
jgi:hypothetical protein